MRPVQQKGVRYIMSFETKARIELVTVIIGVIVLFTLPIALMGVGI